MYRQFRFNNGGPGSLELHLSPFDHLHAERGYLLSVLQEENDKATEFLRRVQPLESSLTITTSHSLRRSLKKQLGWLRCRIRETSRQERSILTRLGQLAYEIQARDRQNQIQYERILSAQPGMYYHWNQGTSQMVLNPLPLNHVSLNPLTPAFQPQESILQYTSLPSHRRLFDVNQSHYESQLFPEGIQKTTSEPYNGGEFPFPRQTFENGSPSARSEIPLRPEISHRCSSMSSVDFNGSPANSTFSTSQRPRRRSFPEAPGTEKSSASESKSREALTPPHTLHIPLS
jgi:hypothetical protein